MERNCSTCRHAVEKPDGLRISCHLFGPCLSYDETPYANWEPKEEEKRWCYTCKYVRFSEGSIGPPLIGCDGDKNCCAPSFSAWESKKGASKVAVPDADTADRLLATAAELLKERGKSYEKGSERSMENIVAAFNKITGHNLTETQGWQFMQVLKLVRANNSKTLNRDSFEDGIAYAALAAEAAFCREVRDGKL